MLAPSIAQFVPVEVVAVLPGPPPSVEPAAGPADGAVTISVPFRLLKSPLIRSRPILVPPAR